MNPFEMVVIIVAIVSISSVIGVALKARHGIREDKDGNPILVNDGETQRLRDEVRTLKERVAVLERIATDRNHSLEQEIERLRDN
jgi:hypothetical protein